MAVDMTQVEFWGVSCDLNILKIDCQFMMIAVSIMQL